MLMTHDRYAGLPQGKFDAPDRGATLRVFFHRPKKACARSHWHPTCVPKVRRWMFLKEVH